MQFAGVSYWAILVAAVGGWLFGAVWYMALANPWLAATGLSKEAVAAQRGGAGDIVPLLVAFVADLVMAWVLAGVLGHLGPGEVTLKNGVISGAFCWLGFVITTMAVNNQFTRRNPMLLVIDGGHWLGVLALMGAIIGLIGVK